MTSAETLKLIDDLRARGAVRVRVGDVEVEFAGAPRTAEPAVESERLSPEQRQQREREQQDALLFAACG